VIRATLVNCTGFADISGLSALNIMPRAGGSKLTGTTSDETCW
jgi:hypothetical protein